MSVRAPVSALALVLSLGSEACVCSDPEAPTGAAPQAVRGDEAPRGADAAEHTGALERSVEDADDEGGRSLARVGLSEALGATDVEEAPRKTAVADPAKGTPEVTVVGRLVGLPERFPPHCGRGYFSIFAEYEVVHVVSGTLTGGRFFAVHGCPEMLRSRLGSLDIGDVHRLELSTDPRGRTVPLPPSPPPRPPFYWTRRVEKE